MAPKNRLLYALVFSVLAHLVFLASIQGWDGGRSGPLRFPGVLLVELINLSSSGAHASPTTDRTSFDRASKAAEIKSPIAPRPRPTLHRRMKLSMKPDQDPNPSDKNETTNSQDKKGLVPADTADRAPDLSSPDPAEVNGHQPDARHPGGGPDPDPVPPIPVVAQARCANCPPPPYPALAHQRGLGGEVVLNVRVLADGKVGAVYVVSGPGHPLLDDAAVAAVKSWNFYPATEDGKPVESTKKVTIPFILKRR